MISFCARQLQHEACALTGIGLHLQLKPVVARQVETDGQPEPLAFRFRAFRIGGDEFLLLLSQVNATIAQQICSRIETTVSKLDGYAFSVTISTGCAFRSECTSAKELLPLSDRRMYQNKRSKAQ